VCSVDLLVIINDRSGVLIGRVNTILFPVGRYTVSQFHKILVIFFRPSFLIVRLCVLVCYDRRTLAIHTIHGMWHQWKICIRRILDPVHKCSQIFCGAKLAPETEEWVWRPFGSDYAINNWMMWTQNSVSDKKAWSITSHCTLREKHKQFKNFKRMTTHL
jgi:hypothetical protein